VLIVVPGDASADDSRREALRFTPPSGDTADPDKAILAPSMRQSQPSRSVTLHRIAPVPGVDRVKGLGDFLVEVHDWLRKDLVELRRQVDQILDGRASSDALERTQPDLAQEMLPHCLAFCGALERHHTGEDMGEFPMLAQRFPALAPALTKLGEEHTVVAGLQKEIRGLVDGYVPGQSDPTRLRDDLEGLASELEAHFAYEEKTVFDALNATGPAPNIE
jgi:iron-sulfur cluster repair protein YtfE (RIC family)